MTEKNKKSFWGKGIFILYSGFVVLTLSIVVFSSMQDFQLVDENYYEKELNYQDQINRLKESNALAEKPTWTFIPSAKAISIKFPDTLTALGVDGTISFFRPSNHNLDFEFPLELDQSGLQIIQTPNIAVGKWKVKIHWQTVDKEYYIEDILIIE